MVFGSGNLLLNDAINVGSNTVNNVGATLQVNAPMTITGNYSQGAGATLLSGVTSASNYGELMVTGNTTIASGSSVGLRSQSYAFTDGQRYLVVDTAGTASYTYPPTSHRLAAVDGEVAAMTQRATLQLR